MSKFTPGPWKAQDRTIAYEGKGQRIVAECGQSTFREIDQANAKLIAAAPDLYAIAKLILKEWEAPTEGVKVGELIARLSQYTIEARAAIAKAEGKSE
jgi:hypothetical protein